MSRLRGIVVVALSTAGALVVSVTYLAGAWQVSDTSRSPVLVLVSFDGWRWDYIDRYPTPNLRALAERGARAERLVPSFPPLTFPNHYTIVTGLYPEHHGIVANRMRDPAIHDRFTMASETARDAIWWHGEPVWVTAIRQGRRAATMFWPGTEAPIDGVRPTFWKPYDKGVATTARVDQSLAWLALSEPERPSFVSLYFDEVDSASHDAGIDSPEFTAAIGHLDAALGLLVDGVSRLGLADRTTIVVVSDHGMTPLSADRVIVLDDYVDTATLDIFETGGLLALAPKNGDVDAVFTRLHGKHPALAVYRRGDVPARLHYRHNARIAPIVAIPTDGWYVTTRANRDERPTQKATHGYDPRDRSMSGLFVAAGPGVARGLVVPPFENVEIYNFLCSVLRITPAKNDGSMRLVRQLARD
ncbi:MAG TPA: ectonucleotide pyrophosphatase/phosphodiesterase [Vicinamibacterales bacterium]|nr:ectonucleotide pyrophosphatase/phosphodiesterase [Vicinamibacterales bacterium]